MCIRDSANTYGSYKRSKTVRLFGPPFIYILCFYTFVRSLRSSNTNLLTITFARTVLGARSFSVASPKSWSSLPPALHSCNCPNTFHWHLSTHYFQPDFSSYRYLPPCTSDSALLTFCAFINAIYFLTYYLLIFRCGALKNALKTV